MLTIYTKALAKTLTSSSLIKLSPIILAGQNLNRGKFQSKIIITINWARRRAY